MENLVPSLGGVPSPLDYRDIKLGQVVPDAVAYPDKWIVDISKLPVWSQRLLGACVGHACTKYEQRLDLDVVNEIIDLSARFPYSIAKALDGLASEGTYPRILLKAMKDYGCATEKTMPNDTTLDHETYVYHRDLNQIPKEAYTEAKLNLIKSFAAVSLTKTGIQKACYSTSGFSALLQVDDGWWSDKNGVTWDKNRILPIRPPRTSPSGHQVYIYGYEVVGLDMKIYFLNSWSKDWADNGTGWFWLSEYLPYITEGWTIVTVPDHLLEQMHQLPAVFNHHFGGPIKYGTKSDEVTNLQRALLVDGDYDYDVTGYYGDITATAVKAFQRKYQVAPITEINSLKGRLVGPKTISKLNELFDK